MSVPTKVAQVFLYQVLRSSQSTQNKLAQFPIEIIEGDSGLPNLVEAIVNVDTTVFLPQALVDELQIESGDVICFTKEDVQIKQSETNPLYSHIIIKAFAVLEKALPQEVTENIVSKATFLDDEDDSFDESAFARAMNISEQSGTPSIETEDMLKKPVQITKSQRKSIFERNFLTSSSLDDNLEKSVHMTDTSDDRSSLRADLDKLKENWGVDFVRSIPDPQPASDIIPFLQELYESPEAFINDNKTGKTINMSCQVSLIRAYPPSNLNQPYDFLIIDANKKAARLAIFPKYNAHIFKNLLNILKEHNQSIILLQGNFVLSGYHAYGITRATLRPGKGVTIRYIRERPLTDIKPEDYSSFIEYLFCANCPKHTPKDGILFYAGADTYRKDGKYGQKCVCGFYQENQWYRGFLIISNDFTFIKGEYYKFHGLFKVDRNTSYLVMYANDDNSQSRDFNIRKVDQKKEHPSLSLDVCDFTLRPVQHGGSVEELDCIIQSVYITNEVTCLIPYCGKSIIHVSNDEHHLTCEVNHVEPLSLTNISLRFKFNETRPEFEVRLNSLFAEKLFRDNDDLLQDIREVNLYIAKAQESGGKLSDSAKQQLDKIIQQLSKSIAKHIGNKHVKLQVAYRPNESDPRLTGDYSKYFINNLDYIDE